MTVRGKYMDGILDLLSPVEEAVSRAMFGGVGLLIDGLMLAIISGKDQFLFKVDALNQVDFEKAGSFAFRPGANKEITMSYYEVPIEVLEIQEVLVGWAWKASLAGKRTVAKHSGRN